MVIIYRAGDGEAQLADQASFWTADWQVGESEASEQAARGEGTVYERTEDFLRSLRAR